MDQGINFDKRSSPLVYLKRFFSPESKSLSIILFLLCTLLLFLIIGAFLISLENNVHRLEEFFQHTKPRTIWLIHFIPMFTISLLLFILTFKRPKIKFLSFIFIVAGLLGIIIGFGIGSVVYVSVIPFYHEYIEIVFFCIILYYVLVFGIIFTIVARKKYL